MFKIGQSAGKEVMNYLNIYENLITTRKQMIRENLYLEKHHIIPRCLGGRDDKENLVKLTPREHFIAHILLSKMYKDNKALLNAIIIMKAGRGDNVYVNSRLYVIARIKYGESIKGVPKSEETKQKLREANLGKGKGIPKEKGFGEKISKAIKGKPKPYMVEYNKENKIGNKHFEGYKAYTNLITGEVRYSKETLCSDWVLGNENMKGKEATTKGTKWFHCPITRKTKMFKLDEVPEGWVLGRTSNPND